MIYAPILYLSGLKGRKKILALGFSNNYMMLTRRINGQGAVCGLVVGFSGNLWLWRYAPNISWLWWNVIEFFVAYAAGYAMSLIFPAPEAAKLSGTLYLRNEPQKSVPRRNWRPYFMLLALYGTGIFALLLIVTLVFKFKMKN